MYKIVHLSSVHPPFDTRIFYKECRSLASAGYDITFIAPGPKGDQVDRVKILAAHSEKRRFFRFLKTGYEVFRLGIREEADIYHLHDPELLPWGRLFKHLGHIVVFDMHENVPASIETKPWIHPRLRRTIARLYRLVERKLLDGIPVVFAEESYNKNYGNLNSESLTLLNFPILEEIVSIQAKKYEVPTVGYIGSISSTRGSHMTAQALGILNRSSIVNWECIGSIDECHKAELIEAIGPSYSNRARFRGRMILDAGLRIIAKCHVGLAVLQNIPNYYESFPTKMFEYMALGLPVVVSNFPLYKKVVEEHRCGICVNPSNANEIASAISWLIQHPVEAQQMGERGRVAVLKHYNWRNESQKLLVFYSKLLTKSDSRR